MAVGHSDDVDSADAVAAVIEQCRAGLHGLSPQAGILFAASKTSRIADRRACLETSTPPAFAAR